MLSTLEAFAVECSFKKWMNLVGRLRPDWCGRAAVRMGAPRRARCAAVCAAAQATPLPSTPGLRAWRRMMSRPLKTGARATLLATRPRCLRRSLC